MNRTRGPRILGIATILVTLALPLYAGHYSWTTTGPEPGQVFQILSYASDPNRLYVVDSYFGGYLFRSDDRGQNWCYVEAYVPGFVVDDPSHPDVLYAPSYQGVVKTTDGGASWASASVGLPAGYATSLVLAPSNPSVLYVYVAPGGNVPSQLFRSGDGAATWSPVVSNQPQSYWQLTIDAFDADTLYASDSGLYWKSTDGGSTWNPSGTGLPAYTYRIFSDPRVPGTLWAGTSNDGLYKSSDGGASFVPSQVGIEGQYIREMGFDRRDSQTLFAAAVGTTDPAVYGGVFVSRDSGASWDRIDIGIATPHSATAVAVDPAGSARLYVGAGLGLRGGFLRSPDGGATWTRAEKGLSGYFTYAVAAHPGLPNAAFSFSGANFFGTLDAGANWAPLPSPGFTVFSLVFDPTNASVLYGQYNGYVDPTSYGGVYKSTDGGGTWADASVGLTSASASGLAIGVSDSSTILASNQDGIFKTSDAGASWQNVLPGYGRAVAVDPADPQILYASRSFAAGVDPFVRSADGGGTWEPPAGLPQYASPSDLAIPPDDATTVYALTNNAVYKSTDHGLSFAPATIGFPLQTLDLYRLALDPSAPETLYASGGLGGTVLRTTDGAGHWRQLGKAIPALTTLDLTVSSTGRDLYAATAAGLFQFHRGFADLPDADPFWASVDAAAMNGVTAGCGGGAFCPSAPNTRAQIAPMLLRAIEGAGYAPPAATGAVFADVSATSFAAAWIEELARREIAAGCGSGDYCPSAPMTRASLAVMLLKAKHGSDYEPPPATGTVFADVPADAFAAAWIEQLAAEGITAGCGGGLFCPNDTVLRSQAAALIVKTFGLS